jgi:hypothetical protein
LHTLQATAFALNDASRKTLERVGFREVGPLPEWMFIDGEYNDTLVYAVTLDDWRRARTPTAPDGDTPPRRCARRHHAQSAWDGSTPWRWFMSDD